MARSGRVYLFGDGSNRINPIHGVDLAEVCADALVSREQQLDVGGPEVFTYREIAELAFEVLEKPSKITCLPKKLIAAGCRSRTLGGASQDVWPDTVSRDGNDHGCRW